MNRLWSLTSRYFGGYRLITYSWGSTKPFVTPEIIEIPPYGPKPYVLAVIRGGKVAEEVRLELTRVLPPTVFKTATHRPTWLTLPIFLPIFQITYPLFWWDKGNPFFLTSKFFIKKNPELFEFRTLSCIVGLTNYIVVKSLDKSSELVCEIRGYEQLLNCWFQITTFICLLVFFIFFCGISTFVSYNYIKLTKS